MERVHAMGIGPLATVAGNAAKTWTIAVNLSHLPMLRFTRQRLEMRS